MPKKYELVTIDDNSKIGLLKRGAANGFSQSQYKLAQLYIEGQEIE